MGPLAALVHWYESQCDGDWEHAYGVRLASLRRSPCHPRFRQGSLLWNSRTPTALLAADPPEPRHGGREEGHGGIQRGPWPTCDRLDPSDPGASPDNALISGFVASDHWRYVCGR
ncbi:hypothetical protein GR925_01895 [Streptomyces sp. HUCO-GS316]|uniref:Imm53 family immunity protein n=1 Tax=Streptomyces sp. HUCO-GS316 TaxID=2692198 RepID=UPI00136FBE96|nr:Imm53 family immunity protein [Streptomyces sp. HUCO-GS316]MXM62229.1 hypothetical protein [Streptomyces sp. HUCO-GS316]